MKFAIVIIVAFLLLLQKTAGAQTVTLDRKDISLTELFKEIKKQTGYDFLYSPQMVEQAKHVDISVVKATLKTVLDECFAGQPLTYTIDQNTIIVKQKFPVIPDKIKVAATSPVNISGRVVSQIDKGPIANVNVFLSNALVGGKTGDDGTFSLHNVKPGKYELVVSMVGYVTLRQMVLVGNSDVALADIELSAKTISLTQVDIKPKDDHYRGRNLDWFKREFLGDTYMSRLCTILNPEVIDLEYNDSTNVLTGSSYDFILIRNEAMGYNIKYLLTSFVFDNKDLYHQTVHYEGSALFGEMKGTPGQERRWQKAREESYEGSTMHFLRSLLNNRIDEDGFKVFQLVSYIDSKHRSSKIRTKLIRIPLKKDDIIKPTNEEGIYALGCGDNGLHISYSKNHRFHIHDNLNFLDMVNNTESTLVSFNVPYALFDNNGCVLNPNSVSYRGVWGRERIGGLLPVDYDPQNGVNGAGAAVFVQPGPLRDSLQKITNDADSVARKYPAEKLYLDFDKPYYAVGDTLWFKAWSFNAPTLALSSKSGIMYIDVANDSNRIVKQYKMPLQAGISWGNIRLDSLDYKGGAYTVRAYTNWMRNFGNGGFFSKRITVTGNASNTWLINAHTDTATLNNKFTVRTALHFTDIGKMPLANKSLQFRINAGTKSLYKQQAQTDKNGDVNLNFALPAVPASVIVEARDKLGGHSETVPLPIGAAGNADVQFLPEGGSLISGFPATIGFKAIDEEGRGLDISGTVITGEGQQVAAFRSLHGGMGSFKLTAKAGESYRAKVTLPGGMAKVYPLPVARLSGTALQVKNNILSDSVEVSVAATSDIVRLGGRFLLIGKARGVVCYAAVADFREDSIINRKIPASLFPSGIAHFILMTVNRQPLNERAVFIDHHDNLNISLAGDKPYYAPNDSVSLRLKVTDGTGSPVAGNFAVAVTDNKQVVSDTLKQDNMISHILLTSDINGYIEDPGYYAGVKNEQCRQALDNLLLTQGWVNYDWQGDRLKTFFAADGESQVVKGTVTNGFNKPLKSQKMQLFSTSPLVIRDTMTDANGRFSFTGLPRIDTPQFLIKAVGRKSNVGIKMDDTAPPVFNLHYPAVLPWYVNSNATMINYTRKRDSVNNLPDFYVAGKHNLREVRILAKKTVKRSQNLNGPGNADLVLDEKDVEKAGKKSWLQMFQDNIKNFREGWYNYYYIGGQPVVLIVDGQRFIPLGIHSWEDYISEIAHFLKFHNAEEIRGIEVCTSVGYGNTYMQRFFPMVFGTFNYAFIEITTRAGRGPVMDIDPGSYIYKPLAISYPKEFYKPRYRANDTAKHLPDLRSTIHWEPNVFTDKNGEATVSLYAADRPSDYTVTIEGTDGNGNLGFKSQKITVGKKKEATKSK